MKRKEKGNYLYDWGIIFFTFFLALIATTVVITGTLYLQLDYKSQNNSSDRSLGLTMDEGKLILPLKGRNFSWELALTPTQMYRGLSNRDSLCAECGMLFAFPDSSPRGFVMRNMNFPIDIIFVSQGRINSIHANLPPEGANPAIVYQSDGPADMVLEINAGIASELGLKTGDILAWPDLSANR